MKNILRNNMITALVVWALFMLGLIGTKDVGLALLFAVLGSVGAFLLLDAVGLLFPCEKPASLKKEPQIQ